MIRIIYTFRSMDGRSVVNDCLIDNCNPFNVLDKFATLCPKYALKNLVELEMWNVITTKYSRREVEIRGYRGLIATFIQTHKD